MRGTVITAATLFLTAATGIGVASAAGSTEIRFPAGGTSTTVSGSLPQGGEKTYTFDARAGQTATVHVTRSSGTERWTLVSPGGSPLHTGMTEQQSDVTAQLPSTGTYTIDVQTTDAGDYSLELAITGGSGGQVSQVPTGAADTGGGATGGVEDAGLLGLGAAALAAAGGVGAVAARRLRSTAARP